MTFDIQLRQRCPHLAVQSPATLAADRKTINLPYPIGRFGIVRVFLNQVEVPPEGVFNVPSLESTSAGPFSVSPSNSILSITTRLGSEEIQIPTGPFVSGDQVLSAINTSRLVRASLSRGVFVLNTRSVSDPYIRLKGCAKDIGFIQVGVHSMRVYPGWKLVSNQKNGVYKKFIQFKEPVQSNPLVEVTYPFEPSQCPRCLSSQVENDLRFTDEGVLATLRDEELLLQESLKILLTDLGSNPYHPWYGTRIRSRIGKKNVSGTAALLQEDVREALNRYKDLQNQQSKFQTVSARQRISSIDSIQVNPIEGLPTAFEVIIIVRNSSNQPVTVNSVFTVPGVINLES